MDGGRIHSTEEGDDNMDMTDDQVDAGDSNNNNTSMMCCDEGRNDVAFSSDTIPNHPSLFRHYQNSNMAATSASGLSLQQQKQIQMMQFQQLWQQQQQQQQQLFMLQQQQQQLFLLEQQHRMATAQANRSPGSRRRGRILFCEDVFCYSNPRGYDEIVSSWYSRDELAVFKGERKSLIRELKRVNFDLDKIDRTKFHLRGLEPYLSIGYNKHMQKKRTQVLHTVLMEQRNQRSRGIRDNEALREACCLASSWARERAADLGRRDAKAVGNEPSLTEEPLISSSWGHASDISAAPSLCSTVSGSSVSTLSSMSSDASLDSLGCNDSVRLGTTGQSNKVRLERVDEIRHPPRIPPSYNQEPRSIVKGS